MEDIRALLVDDEEDFRRPLSKRLQRRGVALYDAASGEEALSLLASHSIDVVILDVKMPGMDGIETLKRVKHEHPKVEVILLTGQASTQDGVEGIKSGAFDYLTKPIEFEHLFGKITQAYEKIQREEEKAREAAFRAQMEQQMIATERLASLGTLAAGVAHEINNPLAIISEAAGWIRSLLKKDKGAPRKESLEFALEKIEKSVERARRITHQLLGFSRKGDSVLRETRMCDLANEVVELVEREAAKRDVRLRTEMENGSTAIWTDPYQLRQVLVNLMTNAIQASYKGGEVAIVVRGGKSLLVIEVRDTGSGIPAEIREKIFEPFFSTKPPGEGTGLGLSVSRGIVEKLGGKIEVESRLGHGATFRVLIPKYEPDHQPDQRGEGMKSIDGSARRQGGDHHG